MKNAYVLKRNKSGALRGLCFHSETRCRELCQVDDGLQLDLSLIVSHRYVKSEGETEASFTCFSHRHVSYMLEGTMNKYERLYFNSLDSHPAIVEYLRLRGLSM